MYKISLQYKNPDNKDNTILQPVWEYIQKEIDEKTFNKIKELIMAVRKCLVCGVVLQDHEKELCEHCTTEKEIKYKMG